MFWKWQWVIAGKGVQPDNIYTAVFTNCKTPERRSKVSLVALIIWQVFDGAISCDTTWRNKWSSIPGKQSKHFQYFVGPGRWCSRKPFYFTVDFVAMNDKDKGPWGEKKEGVSEWDSKDQKHRKSPVSGKNILCLSHTWYLSRTRERRKIGIFDRFYAKQWIFYRFNAKNWRFSA